MSVTIGVDVEVVDDEIAATAPVATDPLFLIHSAAAELATYTTAADAIAAISDDDLEAMVETFFREGGAKVTVVPLLEGGSGSGSGEQTAMEQTMAQIPAELGPGQVVAPEVNDADDVAELAALAWESNRVFLGDGADGASDEALDAIASAMREGDGARASALMADTLIVPGAAGGTTRDVPASVVEAALMARVDRATDNPGLAAAGKTNATCRYVIGIAAERSQAERNAFGELGINCFRTLYGTAIVPYGYRTVADPDLLPHWWDLSGARVVMAARARAAGILEDFMFGQVDREGAFLGLLETALSRMLSDLQRVGSLYGTPTKPGYRVVADFSVNPPAQLALGAISARIFLKTSPFAEWIRLTITRRPITEEV